MPGNPELAELGSAAAFLISFLKLDGNVCRNLFQPCYGPSAMIRSRSVRLSESLSKSRFRAHWAQVSGRSPSHLGPTGNSLDRLIDAQYGEDGGCTVAVLPNDKNQEQRPSSCNVTALYRQRHINNLICMGQFHIQARAATSYSALFSGAVLQPS